MHYDIKQRGRKSKRDLEIVYLYQPTHKSHYYLGQGCKSLLSIGGGIICNFTPILPYFQDWGGEPRPQFFSGEQIK